MLNGSYFAATILSLDPVEREMIIFIVDKVLNLNENLKLKPCGLGVTLLPMGSPVASQQLCFL